MRTPTSTIFWCSLAACSPNEAVSEPEQDNMDGADPAGQDPGRPIVPKGKDSWDSPNNASGGRTPASNAGATNREEGGSDGSEIYHSHGREGSGGASSSVVSSSGGRDALILHGCVDFEDRTEPAADRSILWNFGLGPERCMLIKSQQTVTWHGDFVWHPITSLGSTTASPITDSPPDASFYSVEFLDEGLFGYICTQHTEMRGAIWVMP